jgi:hypothetical protein
VELCAEPLDENSNSRSKDPQATEDKAMPDPELFGMYEFLYVIEILHIMLII